MSYLAFALKYRPKNFDEVVGQAHVVISLKTAILKDRVHHAYLFSGPRGVGKTSLARILAKSLNCSQGPTVNPCCNCTSCLEIAKGNSLDTIEIDAASNRGIDEIRTLRENVKLSTAYCRYKIYIIDEVHMLTQEAFNALLKTLEEPPAHVKFIFATTHPHKVLPTVLSRCQKFQFNLLTLEEIVAKLKKITELEGIKIKDSLLHTIARTAGGSIRDAESLLDQLVPVILEKGSLEDIFSFLGIIDEDTLNQALKLLIEKDLESSLSFLDKIAKDGKDLGIFLNSFIEHLRNLLLAKISINNFKELSDISPQSKEFISQLSKQISTSDILKIIDLLIVAKDLSRKLNTVRIPLELALIKYSYKPDEPIVPRPSPKAAKKAPKSTPKAETSPVAEKVEIDDLDREIDDIYLDEDTITPAVEDKVGNKKETSSEPEPKDDIMLQAISLKWKELLFYMKKTRAALATHLSYAQPFSSRGRVVTIVFSSKDSFHKEIVEVSKNLIAIEEIVSNFMSRSVGIKFTIKDLPRQNSGIENAQPFEAEANQPTLEETKKETLKTKEEDNDFLNDLLDTFSGKFQSSDD